MDMAVLLLARKVTEQQQAIVSWKADRARHRWMDGPGCPADREAGLFLGHISYGKDSQG